MLNFRREHRQPMQPHVFIATPCYGGVVTQGYMQSVCALMAAAPGPGVGLTLALLGQDALITRCRNTLISHFLATSPATHILFVDADISFEPENVFRLLQARKSIAAGIYPLKAYYWDKPCQERLMHGEPIESAGLHYVGKLEVGDRLSRDGDFATAVYAGTGFMLIERAVIERMQLAYPETRYQGIDAYTSGERARLGGHALFDCIIDSATGTYMSEDFTFCSRWQRLGGQIWLDTAASLTHSGPSDFKGIPGRRFAPPNG